MPSRVVDPQQEQAKRELRLRIGRLRRRINRRLRASQREAGRLTSWRTYVARFPGGSLAAAFGVGLALSLGLSGRHVMQGLGLRLARRGAGQVGLGLWRELAAVWAASTPGRDRSDSTEARDGGR